MGGRGERRGWLSSGVVVVGGGVRRGLPAPIPPPLPHRQPAPWAHAPWGGGVCCSCVVPGAHGGGEGDPRRVARWGGGGRGTLRAGRATGRAAAAAPAANACELASAAVSGRPSAGARPRGYGRARRLTERRRGGWLEPPGESRSLAWPGQPAAGGRMELAWLGPARPPAAVARQRRTPAVGKATDRSLGGGVGEMGALLTSGPEGGGSVLEGGNAQ